MYLKLIYYIITLNSRNMESVNDEDLAQVFYAAMRIKTYLDNALYLSSLLSDLSMFKVNHQIINRYNLTLVGMTEKKQIASNRIFLSNRDTNRLCKRSQGLKTLLV